MKTSAGLQRPTVGGTTVTPNRLSAAAAALPTSERLSPSTNTAETGAGGVRGGVGALFPTPASSELDEQPSKGAASSNARKERMERTLRLGRMESTKPGASRAVG